MFIKPKALNYKIFINNQDKMKKRGISPLIATVLLIGFTIAIAAIVMIWGGNIVKERAQKISAKNEAQTSCATKIEIDLKTAKCLDSKLNVVVENKGSDTINGFRARIHYGDGDIATENVPETISKVSQKTLKIDYDTAKSVDSVEIIPFVIKQSLSYTCSEKLKEIATDNSCK